MKPKIKSALKYLTTLSGLILPYSVLAANRVMDGLSSGPLADLFPNNGGLSGAKNLPQLIVEVIKLMLFFAGSIAIVFVIIGGYFYVTSGGNDEQAEKGKKTLVNAIIGIIVVVMAYVIINVIVDFVGGGAFSY